jgi:ubiquinone/menaquinone biosynthesis C-methylase UbiE
MLGIGEKYIKKSYDREDNLVIDFLDGFKENGLAVNFEYLEAGSGLGRFALIVKDRYKNFSLTCLEINPKLAEKTEKMGIKTEIGNVVATNFQNEKFDIVHCSHVIEHFSYPAIAQLLDELLRITKKEGCLIIRSPLMHKKFYTDLDHVRPYPPESIMNYFNNAQQQKNSNYRIKEIGRSYRKEAMTIDNFYNNRIITFINLVLKMLWIYLGMPSSKPDGYCLILKKIK